MKKSPRQRVEKIDSVVYINGNLVCVRHSCGAEYQVGVILCKKGAFHGETMVVEEEHLKQIGRDN